MRPFRLFVLGAIAIVAACTDPGIRTAENARIQQLVWPRPPAPARVRFVRNVSTPADWGLSHGAMQGLFDKFTGEKPFHFVRPTGVAQRGQTLYVADPGAKALVILDASQSRQVVITRIGSDLLASPVSVTLGPDGGVILADIALGKVFILNAKGALVRAIGGEGRLGRPAGIAYDASIGRLYVSDSAAHRIVVYSIDGAFVGTWGHNGAASGEFNFPTHLALTRDGTLLVQDTLNFRVQALDRDGKPLRHFGRVGDSSGEFAAPKGVAVDSQGRVYVVDALFDAVQIFEPDGALLLGFSERGTRAGQLWLPNGIFIAPDDRIYVADAYNQRIAIFEAIP